MANNYRLEPAESQHATRRRLLKGVAGGLGAALIGPVSAQAPAYPNRPIRMVVPYAAGGAPELFVRPMANALLLKLGQQMVIEYRPGANSQIGAAHVATSPADGYTLLFISDAAMSIAPALVPNLPFNPQEDFVAVTILTHLPFLLVANPNAGVSTVRDLLARARAAPGTVSYGSLGIGSSAHVAMEVLAQQSGVEMLHVPYQGTGPAMAAVVGGEVNTVFASMGPALPHIRAGRLQPVAISSRSRSAVLPEVPTFIESGIPEFDVRGWFGIVARRHTPPAALQLLRREMWAFVSSKEVTEGIVLKNGYEPTTITPEETERFLRENRVQWSGWIKRVQARIRKSS